MSDTRPETIALHGGLAVGIEHIDDIPRDLDQALLEAAVPAAV